MAGNAQSTVTKASQDACFAQYQDSLQCLDRNDYDKTKCGGFFDAYKACRDKQEEQFAKERADVLRNDVAVGWVFKWLDNVSELFSPKK